MNQNKRGSVAKQETGDGRHRANRIMAADTNNSSNAGRNFVCPHCNAS